MAGLIGLHDLGKLDVGTLALPLLVPMSRCNDQRQQQLPAHLAAQEVKGLAPPLAHRPGQARLNGGQVLVQVVAYKKG